MEEMLWLLTLQFKILESCPERPRHKSLMIDVDFRLFRMRTVLLSRFVKVQSQIGSINAGTITTVML